MARHDARNTGRSAAALPAALKLQWRISIGGATNNLLASGGIVGVTQTQYAKREIWRVVLRNGSGKIVWQRADAELVYLKGEQIVIVMRDAPGGDTIQCINWRKNTVIWTKSLGGTLYASSPSSFYGAIVERGTLYCSYRRADAAGSSVLKALKMLDGTTLAERTDDNHEWAVGPPASDGQTLFYGLGHWLHILDAQTLQPRWGYYDGGKSYPISIGQTLLIQGSALNLATRKYIWFVIAGQEKAHCLAPGPPGVLLDIEFVGIPTDEIGVVGLDVATGKEQWRHLMFVNGLAASAGNVVYVPGWHEHLPGQKPRVSRFGPDPVTGGFYALNAATGKLRWKYERDDMRGVSVIAADGALFCLDEAGFLYKFSAVRHRH